MASRYTFFVHMIATRQWLALSREERNDFAENTLGSIFNRYPSVSVRYYDAEAFSTTCSDIAVFETEVLNDYYYLWEAVRDSEVFTVPYFEIVDIIPAIEDGFAEYEQSLASP